MLSNALDVPAGEETPIEIPGMLHGHLLAPKIQEALQREGISWRTPNSMGEWLTLVGVCAPHIAVELYTYTIKILRAYGRLEYSQAG